MDQVQEEEAVTAGVEVVVVAVVVMEAAAVVDTDLMAEETDRTISRYSCVFFTKTILISLCRYGPPVRTDYRVLVENLSSRVSWQVCVWGIVPCVSMCVCSTVG